ncbi:hypothetical protein [Streptomyces sp. NPDC050121]|uniref:hypothetical protein n=1 Tax=Streptomyces sp. NPDC050121 TaxID=3365601 RepID=UPI00379E1A2D
MEWDGAVSGAPGRRDSADAPARRPRPRLFGVRCAGQLLLAGVSLVVGCRVVDTDAVTPVPQLDGTDHRALLVNLTLHQG